MDAKTALRVPNGSTGPLARSGTNAARPRARSTKPLSLSSVAVNTDCRGTQNTKTHPQTRQTGLGHDHYRMYVQERSLKVAEGPVHGLHVLPVYEYSSLQSRDQECCDRVVRSALPQSPCVCVFAPAVLSGRGMNITQQELLTALTCIAALISRS